MSTLAEKRALAQQRRMDELLKSARDPVERKRIVELAEAGARMSDFNQKTPYISVATQKPEERAALTPATAAASKGRRGEEREKEKAERERISEETLRHEFGSRHQPLTQSISEPKRKQLQQWMQGRSPTATAVINGGKKSSKSKKKSRAKTLYSRRRNKKNRRQKTKRRQGRRRRRRRSRRYINLLYIYFYL